MSNTDSKTQIAIAAIFAVVILEGAAILKGINGTYLSLAIGAITTIAGYAYGYSKGQEQ